MKAKQALTAGLIGPGSTETGAPGKVVALMLAAIGAYVLTLDDSI